MEMKVGMATSPARTGRDMNEWTGQEVALMMREADRDAERWRCKGRSNAESCVTWWWLSGTIFAIEAATTLVVTPHPPSVAFPGRVQALQCP
jgi:hypothetical protein